MFDRIRQSLDEFERLGIRHQKVYAAQPKIAQIQTMQNQLYDFLAHLLPNHGIDLAKLNPQLSKREISKGEYLLGEGAVCQFIGLIVKGCFRVFILKEDKQPKMKF